MSISRRSLRKILVLVGCFVALPSLGGLSAGMILVSLGALLHWLSKAYLEQNRRLTTAGPYRWVRNPFYLANLLIDAGIVLAIGRVSVGLVYAIVWTLAYRRQIDAEEAQLRALFGDEFDRYAQRVPRLFPLRSPLPEKDASGRFDLSNPSLRSGREYARLVGIFLAPAVILGAHALREVGTAIIHDAHLDLLGALLMLPVAWILKLGFAETLRRPQIPLLPRDPRSVGRLLLNVLSIAPLFVAVVAQGLGRANALSSVALGIAIVASERLRVGWPRAVALLLAAIASVALAAYLDFFWLAGWAALGLGLATLDAASAARCKARGIMRDAVVWRYAPAIGAGASLMLALLIVAREISA